MSVRFVRLVAPVWPLWPAGTVLLIAPKAKATDVRWVAPDNSTGAATLVDAAILDQIPTVPWVGNFPLLLMSALKTTSG